MFLAGTACLITSRSCAQKISWEQGEGLVFLKGEKRLGVMYDYSEITVKGEPEAAYVQEQKQVLNKEKAGEGEAFEAEWTEAREKKYQKNFEEAFNEELKKAGLQIYGEENAMYTLVVATHDIDLGKGNTFAKKPAKINFSFLVVETADKNHILAKGTLSGVAGEVKMPKGSGWIPGGQGLQCL